MHLGRGGISISSHMIIYHHMPRSNWTNNLHEDLGSGSHFQPRGVNKAKKLVQVLWCWGRDQKKKKKRHVTCLPPTVSAIISSKVRGGWHWPQSIQSFHPLCETAAGGRWGHQNSNIQSFSTFQVSTDCRSSALHASVTLQSLKSCCAKHNIINAPLCMFFRTGGKWCSDM